MLETPTSKPIDDSGDCCISNSISVWTDMYQEPLLYETVIFFGVPSIFLLLWKPIQPSFGSLTLLLSIQNCFASGNLKELWSCLFLFVGRRLFFCFLSKASEYALSRSFSSCWSRWAGASSKKPYSSVFSKP